MKKLFLSFILVIFCTGVYSQKSPETKERPASFPGGTDSLNKFVSDHINYPKNAEDKKIEGIVYVAFAVEKDVKVDSVRIVQGVKECPELDKEAKRVVMSMPLWEPGLSQGKPYRSQFEVPIQFLLSKDSNRQTGK